MSLSKSNQNGIPLTRRQLLAAAGAGVALSLARAATPANAAAPANTLASAPSSRPANKRYLVAADDLFLLQRQKIKAFSIAQTCKLDGIGVDMGSMNDGKTLANELRKPETQKQFLDESKKTGVDICCLAFYGMYAHVYVDFPVALQITEEWIDLLDKMKVKTGFMPLMTKDGTLKEPEHADMRKRTVELLKKVAPQAEKAGVTLGFESNLDGDGYKRFLDEVNSSAVKAFYNPGVGLENKYDVYKDIRDLGKDRLCMLHIEQGSVAPETFEHLLGDGLIDFPKLKAVLDDIKYAGWMCIARSRKKDRTSKVEENFTYNAKFLHDLFKE
jgi:sugar phosphate isomerase/epimerase